MPLGAWDTNGFPTTWWDVAGNAAGWWDKDAIPFLPPIVPSQSIPILVLKVEGPIFISYLKLHQRVLSASTSRTQTRQYFQPQIGSLRCPKIVGAQNATVPTSQLTSIASSASSEAPSIVSASTLAEDRIPVVKPSGARATKPSKTRVTSQKKPSTPTGHSKAKITSPRKPR